MNKILVSSYTFEDSDIMSVNGNLQTSIVGDELSIDTFSAVVRGSATTMQNLKNIEYGTIIRYYHNDEQIGTFYYKSCERVSRDTWQINGISSIGVLDKQISTGGVYNGQTFKTVLQNIIGESSHVEPTYYVGLEYLTTDGSQIINTGINAATNLGYKVDIAPLTSDAGKTYYILGAWYDSSSWTESMTYNYYTYSSSTTQNVMLMGQSLGAGVCAYTFGTRRAYVWNYKGDKLQSHGTGTRDMSSRYPTTVSSINYSIYLFNHHTANTSANPNGAICNFYGAEFTLDSDIIKSFVPVKRATDNVVGLFDTVNKVFYSNVGSGSFTAGPENGITYTSVVIEDNQYQEVEYISSSCNMACIDTNYIPTKDTGLALRCKIDSWPLTNTTGSIIRSGKTYSILNKSPASRYLFGVDQRNADSTRELYQLSMSAPEYYTHTYDASTDSYTNDLVTLTDQFWMPYVWDSTSSETRVNLHADLNALGDFDYVYFNYLNDGKCKIGSDEVTIPIDEITLGQSLLIGDSYVYNVSSSSTGLNGNNTSMLISIKSLQISEGGTVIRNYKPVYRKIDGRAGLYDTITKTFITYRYDSYPFTCGPAVIDEGSQSSLKFDYVIDESLEDQLIFGWLPYDTKRNNLYQLLFATNANIIKGEDGSIIFTYLYNTSPISKSDDDVYSGGSIDYKSKANQIELTEHTYVADSTIESVQIYDNTNSTSDSNIAKFNNAPIIVSSLTTTGSITILESHPNYAKISGVGTISGKPYTHTTGVLKSVGNADTQNSIQVSEATLVSPACSENVMNRLSNYYYNFDVINEKMKFNKERCGNYLHYTNPYDEDAYGFIRKIEYNGSGLLSADFEVIENYTPVTSSNNYNNSVVLTTSGTFTVPEDVTEIKVVMIGGGSGGQSGLAGNTGPVGITQDGTSTPELEHPGGGEGGKGGNPGAGGKVYQKIISTYAGATFSYTIGTGGAGGSQTTSTTTNNAGSAGTASTFGSYSSADGVVKPYLDLYTGTQYGGTGTIYGKQGGKGGFYKQEIDGNEYLVVTGQPVDDYLGGLPDLNQAPVHYETTGGYVYDYSQAWGGYGGGGAYGCNRDNHTEMNGLAITKQNQDVYRGGAGGTGGTPSQPSKATKPGSGGAGGHGGGGGGNGGSGGYRYTSASTEDEWHWVSVPGAGGSGGPGGAGGDGADGCIIVYY